MMERLVGPIPTVEMRRLEGHLLGDMFLDINPGIATNARIRGGWKHKAYARSVKDSFPSLGMVGPRKEVKDMGPNYRRRHFLQRRYTAWRVRSTCLSQLTEQRRRWYPDYKKLVPRDLTLTPETCYWWYLDDGSLKHGNTIRLYTQGFTLTDVEFLAVLLTDLGFHPVVRTYNYQTGAYIDMPLKDVTPWLDYLGPCRSADSDYDYKFDQPRGRDAYYTYARRYNDATRLG